MANKNLESEKLRIELAKQMLQGSSSYRIGIIMGISIGAIFAVAGFILAILGLTGNIEWIIEASNFKSKMINGSPGVVFALMGMIIIWRYKPKMRSSFELGRDIQQLTSVANFEINPRDYIDKFDQSA